ncbi:unnamed protein product [Sphagnum jensenii]|uniref:Peptidase M50 domain-containing protein n=1 Tax=Sphagnum jensenii TaxID=128206 RepID=A0ABP1A7N2_9BRYO
MRSCGLVDGRRPVHHGLISSSSCSSPHSLGRRTCPQQRSTTDHSTPKRPICRYVSPQGFGVPQASKSQRKALSEKTRSTGVFFFTKENFVSSSSSWGLRNAVSSSELIPVVQAIDHRRDGDATNAREDDSSPTQGYAQSDDPQDLPQGKDSVESEKEEEEEEEGVRIEVAPSVLPILEKAEVLSGEAKGGFSLIERNQRKRQAQFAAAAAGKGSDKQQQQPAIIPLSFDADARMNEGRYEYAFSSRLDEDEEFLQINTLDDFYPGFAILLTDALLELGDLMKLFGDGTFFSIQALSRATRVPGKISSSTKFPEDSQLRKSLEGILVYVQALSFFISSLFCGPDGKILNTDENLDTEADLLYNMYYKYKHRQTLTVPLEENELLEQVLKHTSFVPNGKAHRCRQGLMFPGNFKERPAALVRNEIQTQLDKRFEGLIAILVDKELFKGEKGCLIAHSNELLSFSLPQQGDTILFSMLLLGAFVGCLQYPDADPGFDDFSLWQRSIVGLGLLGVGASGWLARKATAALYNVSHMVRLPFYFPVPHQGALGFLVFYKGCLPHRTCLLDLSLSSTCASLAFSVALIWASPLVWGSLSATTADFRGFLLVPEQMFAYSSPLTWLLHKLSLATLSGEVGQLDLVVSPLALAGFLGLHFTAMALLPLGILDGGRIVTGVLGRGVQHITTGSTFLVTAILFLTTSPLLGLAWMICSTPALMDDWFQLDEATQPSLIRKALGLTLVAASVATFIPSLN